MKPSEIVQQVINGLIDQNRLSESTGVSVDDKSRDWPQSQEISSAQPAKRRRTMTWAKFNEHLSRGHGMGHGAEYLPWLTIRRKNASKCSNQVAAYLFTVGRSGHFFSRGEYQIALLLQWLGANDIREQYPIWPIFHPHPLHGAPGTEGIQFGYSQGLLQIAQEAGIDHGVYLGTKIPYVATYDFLVTVRIKSELRLVAISCKPFNDSSSEIKWRTLERLELERRYAEQNHIKYFVASSQLIPIHMAGQLEWCIASAELTETPHLTPYISRFAAEVESQSDLSVAEAVHRASEICKLQLKDGWTAFRHCAWTQKIDIDLSRHLLTSYPVIRGGRTLRDQLNQTLALGDLKWQE